MSTLAPTLLSLRANEAEGGAYRRCRKYQTWTCRRERMAYEMFIDTKMKWNADGCVWKGVMRLWTYIHAPLPSRSIDAYRDLITSNNSKKKLKVWNESETPSVATAGPPQGPPRWCEKKWPWKIALTFQPGSAVFIPKCDRPIWSGCTERAMLLMEAIGRSRSHQRQIKEPCAQKSVRRDMNWAVATFRQSENTHLMSLTAKTRLWCSFPCGGCSRRWHLKEKFWFEELVSERNGKWSMERRERTSSLRCRLLFHIWNGHSAFHTANGKPICGWETGYDTGLEFERWLEGLYVHHRRDPGLWDKNKCHVMRKLTRYSFVGSAKL